MMSGKDRIVSDHSDDSVGDRGSLDDMVRVHLFVSGFVQGVFFRANTASVARSLGLTGWVKNLSDGRVEVVAEGLSSRISELIAWCHEGPSAASVDDVEVIWEDPSGTYTSFNKIH
jgi:acylphosphatase